MQHLVFFGVFESKKLSIDIEKCFQTIKLHRNVVSGSPFCVSNIYSFIKC